MSTLLEGIVDAAKQGCLDRKTNLEEHPEMNGLQENCAYSAATLGDTKTLNDGFISDISSEPFNDSENGSLASCEGSTTGDTLSFEGNFRKDGKTTSKKVEKTPGEDEHKEVKSCDENSQELGDIEKEIQRDEDESRGQSSSRDDVLGNEDQNMDEERNGAEQSEDFSCVRIEPLDDTDDVSQSDEPLQESCDATEITPKEDREKRDLDNVRPAPTKEKKIGKRRDEKPIQFGKKGDLKLRKKAMKRASSDNREEDQSTGSAGVQKKRKKRQKKKGISLPVLEVGKLLEKFEISEERKQSDQPALLDKETETDNLGSDHDISDREEYADSENKKEELPLLLDKETETDKQSSDHDIESREEPEDSEDHFTEDLPALSEKEAEAEKGGSGHDTAEKECNESDDQTEDLPACLDNETEKEKVSSDQDIADQTESENAEDRTVSKIAENQTANENAEDQTADLSDKETEKEELNYDNDNQDKKECDDSEDPTEDLPLLSSKEKETLSCDQDIAEQKKCESSEDKTEGIPGLLDKETEKPQPSSDHDVAEPEDSEDDIPLLDIINRTQKSKTKKALHPVPPVNQTEKEKTKKALNPKPLKNQTKKEKTKKASYPVLPLPNGDLFEEDDYDESFDQKNACQTITSCFVNLTRLTDEECRDAKIASVGCTVRHPTIRQCYVRLQRLTQVCSILVQSKCFVRLNRLPSSMIPPFGKLAFDSDVQIHLDVGPVVRSLDEDEENHLDCGPVTRTVGTKGKRNTRHSSRAKRRKVHH